MLFSVMGVVKESVDVGGETYTKIIPVQWVGEAVDAEDANAIAQREHSSAILTSVRPIDAQGNLVAHVQPRPKPASIKGVAIE